MSQSLKPEHVEQALTGLRAVIGQRAAVEASVDLERSPLHLMVSGAHRFRADTAREMGDIALATMKALTPHFVAFANAVGLPGADSLATRSGVVAALKIKLETDGPAGDEDVAWLAYTVHRQVVAKLETEPVESFCLDFEDGYGLHPNEEEDATASAAARAVAQGLQLGSLPMQTSIRLKSFNAGTMTRAVRTLDIFVSTLLTETGNRLPPGFAIILPKVSLPEQGAALAMLLSTLEEAHGLPLGTIGIEIMVETPGALVDVEGHWALREVVNAAGGRCKCVHFGIYDYTAALGITAAHQQISHPIGDSARHLMQLSLDGVDVSLADSPVMTLPIGPHRPAPGEELSERQRKENRAVVFEAWRISYRVIQNALKQGYYQGWDLHPNQLPVRYAANYAFYRQQLPENTRRLRNYVESATGATRLGALFDDPATVRGLLNTFRRAYDCGAITQAEVEATTLTVERLYRPTFEAVFER
jgi:citrate lyase beta subunit